MPRPKKGAGAHEKKKTPGGCCKECGAPGAYKVDHFGSATEHWTCVQCHEDACRRHIRNDSYIRYGKPL